MGWISPAVTKMKILLQRLWEIKLDWDDPIPKNVHRVWSRWRDELYLLATVRIPRCYSLLKGAIVSTQLHGFSDASEEAYAGVVYLRTEYSDERVHVSLIISKTKVSPIKRLSIPRLELCGAQVLTHLLHRVKRVLKIPVDSLGPTALLFWVGWPVIQGGSRHSSAIEYPTSLINYRPRDGDTFLEHRILLIALHGECFPLN